MSDSLKERGQKSRAGAVKLFCIECVGGGTGRRARLHLHRLRAVPMAAVPEQAVTASPRHSAATPRWGTPADYIARARQCLGGRIELDPMSEPGFNVTVGAERIYTAQDNALEQPWDAETVLLNPAGGLVVEAWRKLMAEWELGHVRRAVWIGFSVEQLALLANEYLHPLDFSWCIPRKRIPFVRHDGFTGSPSHSNYVVAIGCPHDVFVEAFGNCGRVGKGQKARAA